MAAASSCPWPLFPANGNGTEFSANLDAYGREMACADRYQSYTPPKLIGIKTNFTSSFLAG
jgi:hypothetical protein